MYSSTCILLTILNTKLPSATTSFCEITSGEKSKDNCKDVNIDSAINNMLALLLIISGLMVKLNQFSAVWGAYMH